MVTYIYAQLYVVKQIQVLRFLKMMSVKFLSMTSYYWALVKLGIVNDRPKTRCVKCTPMCASARVAPSNIVYSWYGYRSTGTGVLTTKVLLFR